MSEGDGFLSRWSRRKRDAREGVVRGDEPQRPALVEAPPPAVSREPEPAGLPVADAPPEPVEPPPTLDDVAALTRDSDFSRFVKPGVDDGVKQAAMKKLFRSDPHFNVMDGLDVYIDDYSKPDPMPASMLRQLAQSKLLGLFDDEPEQPGPERPPAVADATAAQNAMPRQPAAGTPEPLAHEDPDLRLQPDDAAGRTGAGDGAGSRGRVG